MEAMNAASDSIRATDLFVMLERALRRKTRNCHTCTFSLPFKSGAKGDGAWTIEAAESCSPTCRMALEELLSQFQANYKLSDTGRFYAVR